MVFSYRDVVLNKKVNSALILHALEKQPELLQKFAHRLPLTAVSIATKHYLRAQISAECLIMIYEKLIANPDILQVYPRFQTVLETMMTRVEQRIQQEKMRYQEKEIDHELLKLKSCIGGIVHHAELRKQMQHHLTSLRSIQKEYQMGLDRTNLLYVFSTMRNTMKHKSEFIQ